MINASQEFKKLINSGVKIVNYADITLRNGTVLNLTPEDFVLGGFSMTDETTEGKFGVGYAIGKTINLTIANHTNKFSSYDFYKSIIYMYVAVELEDGRVLKERKGKYYVINPTSPGDTIKLSGVDSMCKFDKPYKAATAYPATLQSILSDCCIDCGVNIGFGEFEQWNLIVTNKPEDVTYRDVVSYVAQIVGSNARINNNDAMELVWYDVSFMNVNTLDGGNLIQYDESDTYDGGDFSNYSNAVFFDGGNFTDPTPENVTKISSLSVSTDEIIISGIKLENDNVEILKGTEEYVICIKDNPLTIGKEEEIATYLYNKLKGYKFRALSCNIANNPLFESYDACYVYDRKGNAYFTLINSVQYKISGFTTIACKAEDPVRNESSYTSDAAKALVQAKRNTEMQLSNYDKAVQNMNLLASNAMGLYRESEKQSDDSEIYYQSNRPITKDNNGKCIFEENAVVYKMTADGFFVSTDGGESFTSGFDSNGNAIVNVLSAIGITFDWAKGGTLSLGGDNNINGSMVVYDAENNIVGKFNKDGLWASNGYFKGTIESQNAKITGGYVDIETSSGEYSSIILKSQSGSIYIRPIGINFNSNWDYGTQIRDDFIKIGIGTSYSRMDYDEIVLTSVGSTRAKISTTETIFFDGTDVNIYGDFYVYGTYLTIDSRYSATYGIKASKDVLFEANGTIKGNVTLGSTSYNSLTIESKATLKGGASFESAATFTKGLTVSSDYGSSFEVNCAAKLNGNCTIGNATTDSIGFFGGNGNTKQTVSTITSTSSATASSNATKINEVINALKKYNLL